MDAYSGVKTEEDAVEVTLELLLGAMLGDAVPDLPGPGEILFMFQKGVFFAILDKVDKELAA